jgi:hypothetical protein
MRRAITRASGGAPKRMQTSKASSVSGGGLTESCSCTSTSGCLRANFEISGATWLRPKPSVAFTRKRPRGSAFASPSSCAMSSIAPRMPRACAT